MLHRAISPRACGCDGWVRSTAGWSIETVENSKYPTQHHDTDRPCPWKELPLMRNRFSEAPKRFICRRRPAADEQVQRSSKTVHLPQDDDAVRLLPVPQTPDRRISAKNRNWAAMPAEGQRVRTRAHSPLVAVN